MPTDVLCIGTTLIDELFFCNNKVIQGTSNPAKIKRTVGGVMSNIVQHLKLLNVNVDFITVLGNDSDAQFIEDYFFEKKISLEHSIKVPHPSGKYVAIHHNDGSLYTAACNDEAYKYLTADFLQTKEGLFRSAKFVVCDTNINSEAIQWLINCCNRNGNKLIIEPVSVLKAQKLLKVNKQGLFMITPNEDELQSLSSDLYADQNKIIKNLISSGLKNVWLRKGIEGSAIYNSSEFFGLPAVQINVKDTTGAGDSALAAWIWATLHLYKNSDAMAFAHSLAFEVLQQEGAVLTTLNENLLINLKEKYYPND